MAIKSKLYPQNSEEVLYPETSIDQVKGRFRHTVTFDVSQYEPITTKLVFIYEDNSSRPITYLGELLNKVSITSYVITDTSAKQYPVIGFLGAVKNYVTPTNIYYRVSIYYSDKQFGIFAFGAGAGVSDVVEEL